MGVVWRATDTVLGRDVALKVLPGIFADDPERRTRFEREARLLATLNHPNIATIHGLHACDGIHFLVMELIPGRDLSQLLAQGAPDLEETLRIAREIPSNHLRRLGVPLPIHLPGTEQAASPFFSPDGQWIGFFARGKLWKTSVDGGTPIELTGAPSARGGDFLPDGSVVLAPTSNSGLQRIESPGGKPATLTEPDRAAGERTHRWPAVLPGGKAVLFTIGTQDNPGNYEDATIAAVDLETRRSSSWSGVGASRATRRAATWSMPAEAR